MNRIWPSSSSGETLFLATAFPFVGGATIDAFQRARVTLKLDCLIHGRAILPGSLAISAPLVRELVLSNLELLQAGCLALGLRDQCPTFESLAKLKYDGSSVPEEVHRAALLLDEHSRDAFVFRASDTSDMYRRHLLTYLRELRRRARKVAIKDELMREEERLDAHRGLFGLNDACSVGSSTHYRSRIRKAAKYLYCAIGGAAINSTPQVPPGLWEAVSLESQVPRHSADDVDPLHVAHSAVLRYFSIDSRGLDAITPQQILELREEGLVQQFKRELDRVVDAVTRGFLAQGHVDPRVFGATAELAKGIREKVYQNCRSEAARRDWFERSRHMLHEVGGYFVPGLATAEKGSKWLARVVGQRTKLKWLDVSSTPFTDYSSRLQAEMGKGRKKGSSEKVE